MTTLETIAIAASPLTILIPKNRGLLAQIERALQLRAIAGDAHVVRVRGEDVPLLANEFGRAGRRVLAFTGDDLLDEWLAGGNALCEPVVRDRIAWSDPAAIYGAPALCLVGRPGDALRPGEPARRVAVCARYRALARGFTRTLGQDGIALETMLVSGEVETFVASGVADFAIDIVVTGSTLERTGLSVRRVISTSDIAVLETR
jgi:ATP phosphoribosyltransferase